MSCNSIIFTHFTLDVAKHGLFSFSSWKHSLMVVLWLQKIDRKSNAGQWPLVHIGLENCTKAMWCQLKPYYGDYLQMIFRKVQFRLMAWVYLQKEIAQVCVKCAVMTFVLVWIQRIHQEVEIPFFRTLGREHQRDGMRRFPLVKIKQFVFSSFSALF